MSVSFENSCAPEIRSLIASRLSAENRHRRQHLYTSSKTKKYICVLTFYQATWLTYRERWFKWVTAIRITSIIFEFANLWLDALNEGQVYPWVHRWRLILPVHIYTTHSPSATKSSLRQFFSISYELFRLPSAKVHRDYQFLRSFDWCLMEKLPGNNGPFLDRCAQLIQSIKAMPMGAWLYF